MMLRGFWENHERREEHEGEGDWPRWFMGNSRRSGFGLTVSGWMLVAVGMVLFCLGVFFVVSSPALWGRCLYGLDMRNWTRGAWTGVLMALLVALMAIHFWPEKGKDL